MFTPAIHKVSTLIYFSSVFVGLRISIGGTSALFLLSKGISLQELGLIKSVQAFTILIIDVPLAYVADKYSRSLSIVLSVLFSSIWLFTTALADSLPLLMVAEVFNALSIALFNGAFIAHLLDKTPKNQTTPVIARLTKVQHLFMSFSALITPFFITDVASNKLWLIVSALMFVLFVVSLKIIGLEKTKYDVKDTIKIKFLLTYLKNIPLNKMYIFALIVFSLCYQVLIQYWQPIIKDVGSLYNEPYMWGCVFFLILIVQSFSAHLMEKNKPLLKYIVISFLIFVAVLLIHQANTIKIIYGILWLFFVIKIITIHLYSEVHKKIDANHRATIDSIISTSNSVLVMLAMPLFGLGLSHFIES